MLRCAIETNFTDIVCFAEELVKKRQFVFPLVSKLRMKSEGRPNLWAACKGGRAFPCRGCRRYREEMQATTYGFVPDPVGLRIQVQMTVKIDHRTP